MGKYNDYICFLSVVMIFCLSFSTVMSAQLNYAEMLRIGGILKARNIGFGEEHQHFSKHRFIFSINATLVSCNSVVFL